MTTVAELETDLIPTLCEPPAPPSRREPTEDELLERYSALMWEALVAFATDPSYATEMCEAANLIDYRKQLMAETLRRREEERRLRALRERLGGKVTIDGECWTWTAATTGKGVPAMKPPGSTANVTVRSWTVEQWHGPDKTRWMIQASCGNRLCVSPLHATWRHVDRRRGENAGKYR